MNKKSIEIFVDPAKINFFIKIRPHLRRIFYFGLMFERGPFKTIFSGRWIMQNPEFIPHKTDALDGLERLAFGSVNDAVRLLVQFNELDSGIVSDLDLFSVSEIKRNKEGMLEIKFYDRLKALELLAAYSKKQDDIPAASSFYGALESAAKSACDADEV